MSHPSTVSLDPIDGPTVEVIEALRDWLDGGADPLVIATSGSTGEPKHVVLPREAVLASAHATHRRLGGPGQWLLALPVTGIAGVQVVVRSLLAGFEPVLRDDFASFAEAWQSMGARRTYASLVPTQLHRMASAGTLAQLAGLDALLIGGASVDPGLLEQARGAGVHVVRTYGMSETCGGCVYDGVPLEGVYVDIDPTGQILLGGDVLFTGYRDQQATARVMRDGWLCTGDLGYIENGRLEVTGRADDVVVSGGINVPTASVRDAVRQLDGVRQVEVLGVPDAEWGSKVVAFIVPRDAVCLDGLRLDQVRDAVEEDGLPRQWAPQSVVLCDAFPLLDGGKIDRQALMSQAGRDF